MRLPSPYRWQEYKRWTQLELTQNVVRYLLSVLREPKCSGMLIHCISGWDRTPHIVSLLRILLWAEGESHQSLNVDQMLYLTVAYDWFLFGHQLAHRLKKSHEIMFYTFDVLGHLLSADFSLYLGDYVPPTNVKDQPQLRTPAASTSTSPIASPSLSGPVAAPSAASSDASNVQSLVVVPTTEELPSPQISPSNTSEATIGNAETAASALLKTVVDTANSTPISASPSSGPTPSINITTHNEISAPVAKKPSPDMAEMLNQPVARLDLDDRIAARKHRLFELRDRFFFFYKTCIYPTYHK